MNDCILAISDSGQQHSLVDYDPSCNFVPESSQFLIKRPRESANILYTPFTNQFWLILEITLALETLAQLSSPHLNASGCIFSWLDDFTQGVLTPNVEPRDRVFHRYFCYCGIILMSTILPKAKPRRWFKLCSSREHKVSEVWTLLCAALGQPLDSSFIKRRWQLPKK